MSVVFFARRGLRYARYLVLLTVLASLLVFVLVRYFGKHKSATHGRGSAPKLLTFFAATYALKNTYQAMLCFALPFYWRASTVTSENVLFVVALALCAIVSTLDILFDRYLLRLRPAILAFHGLVLFACIQLASQVMVAFAGAAVLITVSGALAAAVLTAVHIAWRDRIRATTLTVLATCVGAAIAFASRTYIPPAPLQLAEGAVGLTTREDGSLREEIRRVDPNVVPHLIAVADVAAPTARRPSLRHVWRRTGTADAHSVLVRLDPIGEGLFRSCSTAEAAGIAGDHAGVWEVDVETEEGLLVGRIRFEAMGR